MSHIRLRHMPALDGLRGLAVAGVLLYHAGHLAGGYLGVDLFFVLSGYLITSLLLGEWRADGRVDLRAFWSRRARRLLPAVFALLVAVAIYASLLASPVELARIRADGLATLLYVANWHSIFDAQGYFQLFGTPSPLEHTWSLAIEEQFYLLWPLVAFVLLRAVRGNVRWLFALSCGLAVLSVAWMAILFDPNADVSRVYLGTDTRGSSILFGAALACLHSLYGHTRRRRARVLLEVAAGVAAAGLAFAWVSVDGTTPGLYRGGLALCGLAVVVVIAAASHPRPGPLAKALSLRPLRWLGLVSYGLYLWHWPVDVVLNPVRVGFGGWSLVALRLGTSIALAALSYYLLELPIRRGVLKGWSARILTPAAAGVAATAIVISTVGTAPVLASAEAGPVSANALRIMLVGDSGAERLGERMHEVSGEFDVAVFNRANLGCRLFRGDGLVRSVDGLAIGALGPKCGESWVADLAAVHPDLVLLHLAGAALSEVRVDGKWEAPCAPTWDDLFIQEGLTSVKTLAAQGARVVLATTPHSGAVNATDELRERIDSRTDCVNEDIRAVVAQSAGAAVLDLDAFICPERQCRREQDGVVLREDGLHFEGAGGQLVARWVIPQLTALGATAA